MNMNIDMIREISTSSSQISFKESSTHSAISSTLYYKRIEIQNNLLNEDIQKPVKNFELSYVLNNKQVLQSAAL